MGLHTCIREILSIRYAAPVTPDVKFALKQTSVLVDNGGLTNVDINALLAADPPRRYPPELSEFRPVEVAVSQPLPAPTIEEAMTRTFCISDMGSVWGKQCLKAGKNLSPRDLQAPEVILGALLDEKVDIWLFGLLVSRCDLLCTCGSTC
ncbi:hypothetical protein LXA43DRAFT_164964 [Ganoderma leucocontextum]|nr:hypothetical protein LXA43DRAFT_164964 [Ganoderma leucocontextum]